MGTTKVNTLFIKMAQGCDFSYEYETDSPNPLASRGYCAPIKISASVNSRTSYYYAPDDGTNVVFVSPASPKKSLLPTFKTSDFHYTVYGGSGNNIYKLGNQQVTIYCGSGLNAIEVPFDQGTDERTITLKNFSLNGYCSLELKGVRVNFDLFQNAKIWMDTNFYLFLKFGSTIINFGSVRLIVTDSSLLYKFDSPNINRDPNIKDILSIKTDDGIFNVDLSLFLHDVDRREKNLKNYISSSIICNVDKENLILNNTNVVSLKDEKQPPQVFKDQQKNGDYSLSLRHITNDSEMFKNAELSFTPNGKILILTFGERIIKFEADNIKNLAILTDDHICSINVELAKEKSTPPSIHPNRPLNVHGDEKIWEKLKLKDYIISLAPRNDNIFYATKSKDIFFFDAKNVGKITIKDFSIPNHHNDNNGDLLQITNSENFEIIEDKTHKTATIVFDEFNQITLTNIEPSQIERFFRKPEIYAAPGKTDEIPIDATKSGRITIKNFSPQEKDALHISNASKTKEELMKTVSQNGNDLFIAFDQHNSVTLENVNLPTLQNQNYDYLLFA